MKNYLVKSFRAAIIAVAALFAVPAPAQVVTQLPVYINPGVATDFGNGPLELRLLNGNALLTTSQSSGVGSTSGASTTLTLTATPTTPPCVGCIVNAPGVTSGTLVASYNGGLIIGLPTAATVPAASAIAWGAACVAGSSPPGAQTPVQAAVGGDMPFYTQSRICGYSPNGPGASTLPFAIGAH